MSIKQISVIAAVAVLMVALYMLPIKGLINEPEPQQQGAVGERTSTIGLSQILAVEKQNIEPSLLVEIEKLEGDLEADPKSGQVLGELSDKWAELNVNNVSGLYQFKAAELTPNYNSWLKAGDRLREGFKYVADSVQKAFLVQKALTAYQNAVDINPDGLDARTGLGATTVEGTGSPMAGIQMLLGVLKEDPKNAKANLTLAVFSMQTRQFEKAVERLQVVVKQEPSGEAYFYLGEAYRGLGDKQNAIAAYQKSKEFIVDPQFVSVIDNVINELQQQ